MRRLAATLRAHADATALLAIGALPFVVLGRALLPGRVLSPADIVLVFPPWSVLAPGLRMGNPLLTDIAFMFHPWQVWAGRELAAGHLPLWNPYVFAGAPFFANPQTALLFPLTWLAAVLPAPTAVTLIVILKLSLAGTGTYVFLRQLAVTPLSATLGALAFMLNGALVTWAAWAVGSAMAMLPWLFVVTERLRRRATGAWTAGLALVVAAAIAAGYLQTTVLGLFAAGLWALVRARESDRPLAFIGRWAVGAGLGALASAVQLLPFVEYARLSSVYAYRTQWMPVMAVPLRMAVALFLPQYYGSPLTRDFWGYWNFNEIAATVGLVPWIGLPAAVVGAWSRPKTGFFLVIAVVAALACYDVPVVTAALDRLPPLSLVIAFRVVAFLAFALAVLGAIGFDVLRETPPPLVARAVKIGVAAVVVGVLAVVADDGPLPPRGTGGVAPATQYVVFLASMVGAGAAALTLARGGRRSTAAAGALIVVQLASTLPLAATYNPVIDAGRFYPPPPPAVRHLQMAEARDPGRVFFPIGKNIPMLYGLRDVTGYDGMTPRRIEQLLSPGGYGLNLIASGSLTLTLPWSSPLFDLLGVRRLMLPPGTDRVPPHFVLDYDGPDGRVWRNPRALPRALLVPSARCVGDLDALDAMHGGRIDFRTEVLVHDCAPLGLVDAAGGTGSARIVVDEAERVVVTTDGAQPAYLLLVDAWFPGWRAWVDGVEHPVWRADYAFRAVRVPAGRHEVEWRYRPASLTFGLAVSLVALAAIAALFVTGRGGRA